MTTFLYEFGGALASAVIMTCPFWIPALVVHRREQRKKAPMGYLASRIDVSKDTW